VLKTNCSVYVPKKNSRIREMPSKCIGNKNLTSNFNFSPCEVGDHVFFLAVARRHQFLGLSLGSSWQPSLLMPSHWVD